MISMWHSFALLGVEIKDESSMWGIEIGWQSVVYAANGWKKEQLFCGATANCIVYLIVLRKNRTDRIKSKVESLIEICKA